MIKKFLNTGAGRVTIVIGTLVLFVLSASLPRLMRREAKTTAVVSIGGAFEMVDNTGKTVTDKDYADKPQLLFFGFTHCPGICPITLQRIADSLEMLGLDGADRLHVLFVTTDPDRDTPEVMDAYVNKFSPKIIGLTGTQAQVDSMVNGYRVYAQKGALDETGDYSVDHSAFTYLMSKDGQLEKIFRSEDSPEEIAGFLKTYLGL